MKKLLLLTVAILSSSIGLFAGRGNDSLDAARDGDLNRLKSLIESGVSANYQDDNGWSAFLIAARFGHLPILEYLLSKGADVKLTNNLGKNALMIAVGREGEYEGPKAEQELSAVVKLLIDKGIEVDLQDSEGNTALVQAAAHGWKMIVEQLLEKGASPWIQAKDGKTALTVSKVGNASQIDEILARRMHVKVK